MLHYHVTCKSDTFNYPDIVTTQEKRSHEEFMGLMHFAYEYMGFTINGVKYPPHKHYGVEGCPIVLWTSTKGLFLDGTTITRHVCMKDCVERLIDAELADDPELWTPDLRNIIFEL